MEQSPQEVPPTVVVASLQSYSVLGDTQGNVERFAQLAREAVTEGGAKFLVLPETAIHGYLSTDLKTNWWTGSGSADDNEKRTERDEEDQRGKSEGADKHRPSALGPRPCSQAYTNTLHPKDYAEEFPSGPSLQYFANLAKELDAYITVPFLEKAEWFDSDDEDEWPEEFQLPKEDADPPRTGTGAAGTTSTTAGGEEMNMEDKKDEQEAKKKEQQWIFYNSACLATPRGELVAHYRKLSPWPTPERSWATAGDLGVAPYETPEGYGKVGLAICFDIHSILSKYKRHKLWTLLYPIAWVGDPMTWYRKDLPHLLKQTKCPHHIIGCNWAVEAKMDTPLWDGAGISTHYGLGGDILASTTEYRGGTILYSTIFTKASPQFFKEQNSLMEQGGLNLDIYAEWTNTIGKQAKEWKWRL